MFPLALLNEWWECGYTYVLNVPLIHVPSHFLLYHFFGIAHLVWWLSSCITFHLNKSESHLLSSLITMECCGQKKVDPRMSVMLCLNDKSVHSGISNDQL